MKNKKIYENQCGYCHKLFMTTRPKSKTCGNDCRYKLRTSSNMKSHNCPVCDKSFVTTSTNADGFCGPTCRTISRSWTRFTGTEGLDYIVCPVCNLRTKQITPRHAQMHGFNTATLFQQHVGMERITCDSTKAKFQGANNPGYQHGGRLSHFSKNFIHGYDEEKHNKLISDNSYRNKNSPELFKTNIAYWLKKADGDESIAKQLYTKFQTRNLEWFVEKYGRAEGIKRHAAKTEKWINTLQAKPVEELLSINRKKLKKSGRSYSLAEKELFYKLKEIFPELSDQFAICIDQLAVKKHFYIYDMSLGNKLIEYYGDFWHANPNKYNSSFICPYTKLSYDEIHEKK